MYILLYKKEISQMAREKTPRFMDPEKVRRKSGEGKEKKRDDV